jgi:hypothetical protein
MQAAALCLAVFRRVNSDGGRLFQRRRSRWCMEHLVWRRGRGHVIQCRRHIGRYSLEGSRGMRFVRSRHGALGAKMGTRRPIAASQVKERALPFGGLVLFCLLPSSPVFSRCRSPRRGNSWCVATRGGVRSGSLEKYLPCFGPHGTSPFLTSSFHTGAQGSSGLYGGIRTGTY